MIAKTQGQSKKIEEVLRELSAQHYPYTNPISKTMSQMMANHNYAYGAIFLTPTNKVLLVKGRKTGKWSFPKGHPNSGETAFEAAEREVAEEVGLRLPQDYEHIITLNTGIYYLIRSEEISVQTNDETEVIRAAWIPFSHLSSMRINIDVTLFLQNFLQEGRRQPSRNTVQRRVLPQIPTTYRFLNKH
jgi:8-oxo-dGTP pyrophosphatase MutT (NUDIX family)